MKYRYLYQIVNLTNNKIYVGVHVTDDLEDGYMGSGKVIRRAILKHGIDNFKKDVLEFFESDEDMYAREKEIVTEEFLSRRDVYNLRRGGFGGFDFINSKPDEFLTEKRLAALKPHPENLKPWFYGLSGEERSAKAREYAYKSSGFSGKNHSDKTKSKIGLANKSSIGQKNSQYGTIWITNGSKNRKNLKEATIPEGFWKGRSKGT